MSSKNVWPSPGLHLDLDGAWTQGTLGLRTLSVREWGPKLRFSSPERLVEEFYALHRERLDDFILSGSGDFHHLSALWLRRVDEPVVLVSFDNHPDWDIRPPKWCCGNWLNRAMDLPQVERMSVWGCGNFECWWPGQIFGNRRAEREGRLEVHPWADDRSEKEQNRRGAIRRENWRSRFEEFVAGIAGGAVYVTIDLDCFGPAEVATNWENGRFSVADVAWALQRLKSSARIVAGDICGAYSSPVYSRWKQRFAANFDHPHLPPYNLEETRRLNGKTVEALWPLLAEGNEKHSKADEQRAKEQLP